MQAANDCHSEAMAFAFVSVSVAHDFKPFNAPIHVFNQNAQSRQLTIIRFFFHFQLLILPLFNRCFTVCVNLNYALVTTICQNLDKLIDSYEFVLQQLEIVGFAHRLRDANYFGCFAIYDDLRF